MILICYDGSQDAQAAIERAGSLFKGEPATVLTVWVPFIEVMAHNASGLAFSPGMVDIGEIDAANQRNAHARAEEGAERARGVGLNPQPRIRAQETSVAVAILAEAEDVDASVIVIGTRGLRGLKSMVLGSVSHAVISHAGLPVLVVPSAEVAAARTPSG
jgi:nucleotide-binding universal stress UspA family protein